MITANVRFPEKDYQKYRLIALKQKKSFAQLVRDSLERVNWHLGDIDKDKRSRQAANRILNFKKIKSDLSIREMIESGRKY